MSASPIDAWLSAATATVELAGSPALRWALDREFASAETAFAETSLAQLGEATVLTIDLHPKSDGLQFDTLRVAWSTRVPGALTVPATAQRAIALSGGRDPLVAISLDELGAATLLDRAADGTLSLKRQFGRLPLAHTVPALRLLVGRASAIDLLREPPVPSAAGRSLLVDPTWVSDGDSPLDELLRSPQWATLGVGALVLDARLSLSAPLAPRERQLRWAAFAKTCHAAGVQPGVTVVPAYWTDRGSVDDRTSSPVHALPRPPWLLPKLPRAWVPAAGDYGTPIDYTAEPARDALAQCLLWLGDSGFTRIDLLALDARADLANEARAHRSTERMLRVLAEAPGQITRYADTSLPAVQQLGMVGRLAGGHYGLVWRAPRWWSRRSRRRPLADPGASTSDFTSVATRVRAQLGIEPVVARGAYDERMVWLGAPPPRPPAPPPPREPLVRRIVRVLRREPAPELAPPAPAPAYPPTALYAGLARAFGQS